MPGLHELSWSKTMESHGTALQVCAALLAVVYALEPLLCLYAVGRALVLLGAYIMSNYGQSMDGLLVIDFTIIDFYKKKLEYGNLE